MATCISPIQLKDGDLVPCGSCNFCLVNYRNQWAIRLLMERRYAENAQFVTWTYAEECIPLVVDDDEVIDYAFSRDHIKTLMRDIRKYNPDKVKQYTVYERGGKFQRPHYHSLIFGVRPHIAKEYAKLWNRGNVKVGSVTPASIGYCTHYVVNNRKEWFTGEELPRASISNGIGEEFYNRNKQWFRGREKIYLGKYLVGMPRYYRLRSEKEYGKESKVTKDIKKKKQELKRIEYEMNEIERLKGFHEYPELYMEELRWYKHSKIKEKGQEKEKQYVRNNQSV